MIAVGKLFRNSSLSNQHDHEYLRAHPEVLIFSDLAVRDGRTRVAVGPHGNIVGFATWLVTESAIELEDLFVDPQWMRQGIGRELVDDAAAIAQAQSFDRIEVTANPHALGFYTSTGFVVDRMVETDFYPAPRMYRALPARGLVAPTYRGHGGPNGD